MPQTKLTEAERKANAAAAKKKSEEVARAEAAAARGGGGLAAIAAETNAARKQQEDKPTAPDGRPIQGAKEPMQEYLARKRAWRDKQEGKTAGDQAKALR